MHVFNVVLVLPHARVGTTLLYVPVMLSAKHCLGYKFVLEDPDIWLCSTCFNCYEHCPRTIPVTEIILSLRRMAVTQGHLPDPLKGVIHNLMQKGHTVPIDPKWSQLRARLDLEPMPPTVEKYPKALDEIYDILAAIRFNARVPHR